MEYAKKSFSHKIFWVLGVIATHDLGVIDTPHPGVITTHCNIVLSVSAQLVNFILILPNLMYNSGVRLHLDHFKRLEEVLKLVFVPVIFHMHKTLCIFYNLLQMVSANFDTDNLWQDLNDILPLWISSKTGLHAKLQISHHARFCSVIC